VSNTLTSRVLSSLVWVFTNIATKNLIEVLRMWLLWKILGAEDFGINAMAWLVINGSMLLQDAGFANALIQRKTDIEAAVSITWYANLAIRGVVYAVIYFAAPLFAAHFGEELVTQILRLAGLTVLLGAFGSANEALLRKEFRQKKLLLIDSAENLVLAAVQIAAALSGLGVWSLALGAVAGALARSALLWWYAPIHVGRVDWRVFREMWGFGMHMSLSTVGLWLMRNMDYYFVGKFFGPATLGFYTLAFKLANLIATNVIRPLGSVLFPAFAAIGQDIDRARGAWLRSERYTMLLVMPMGVVLMIFAAEIVGAFFKKGIGFIEAGVAIQTVFALCRGLGVPLGDLAKGIGKPWILTRVVGAHVAVMGPALWGVCWWGSATWGTGDPRLPIIAVSSVVSLCGVGAVLLSFFLTSRFVPYTIKQVVGALLPAFGSAVVMALATWIVKELLAMVWPELPPLAVLCIAGPLAGGAYVAAFFLLFRSAAEEMKGLWRSQVARRQGKAREVAAVDG
jgi:O-antigen/teichoic acid export membrane protein